MINLPVAVFNKIKDKKNILISGMGGGFDVYGGLPLYHYLKKIGKNVILANYSFTNFSFFDDSFELKRLSNFVVGTKGVFNDKVINYFPEGYLARWLNDEMKINDYVWMFPKVGPNYLNQAYKKLIATFNIDFVFLVDGGVDSLMTGDEEGFGTIIEDSITLAAINSFENLEPVVVNIGFFNGFGSAGVNRTTINSSTVSIVKQLPDGTYDTDNYPGFFEFLSDSSVAFHPQGNCGSGNPATDCFATNTLYRVTLSPSIKSSGGADLDCVNHSINQIEGKVKQLVKDLKDKRD